MRVFLTGGTGLLGSHTAEALVARGHEVVALHRPTSDTAFLASLGCELVEGDVTDPVEHLAAAAEGCTHAVHGVALVYAGDDWDRIREVNVGGTARVLDAVARAGVGYAVHLSTVAVYGTADGPIDESEPIDRPVPEDDYYARSKRLAEAEARRVASARGLSLSILRPAAVYGERDRLMAPSVARMTRFPVAFLLGSGHNAVPAVYAGNVALAVLSALEAERDGAVWNVGLDHRLTQRDLLRWMAVGLGRRPFLIAIPAGLVRVGADVLERLGVSTPGAEHLPLGRAARLSLGENPYPSTAIRDDLGWDPPHRPEEAVVRTGRWLRENDPKEHR